MMTAFVVISLKVQRENLKVKDTSRVRRARKEFSPFQLLYAIIYLIPGKRCLLLSSYTDRTTHAASHKNVTMCEN